MGILTISIMRKINIIKKVLLDINNSLICLCEVLGSEWKNPVDAIPQLLEWAYAEKRFLMMNNERLGLRKNIEN